MLPIDLERTPVLGPKTGCGLESAGEWPLQLQLQLVRLYVST